MTQPDYGQFQVGGVLQPLPTSLSNSLLRDADPTLFFALDFWTYVINTYPGPRLIAAAAAAGITLGTPPGGAGPAAVASSYPYEPLPEQLENQFRFPLLCVYRTDIRTEWFTVGFEHDISVLELMYVLPPMDAAGTERLAPILHAVMQALRRKTTDAWDPGYTPPGGNQGDQFDSASYANVEEIGFGEYQGRNRSVQRMGSIGYMPNSEGLYFPCLKMQGYVVERDMYAPTAGGPSKVTGADITGNVQAADGTVVPAAIVALVQVSTQLAPTITSLSVTTGPATGATSITLSGTNFLAGPPVVYFGPSTAPQYATGVTYNSPTSVTVTTPAMQGAGTVDVTITNRDGQSGTLAQSFTFT